MKVEIVRTVAHGTITLRATDSECGNEIEFSTGINAPSYDVLKLLLERAAQELGRQRMKQLLGGLGGGKV